MTRVALYVRCSTEEQATEGLSIEGQRSVLHSYCHAKGLEVVEEFVDEGRSGRFPNRPEFQRMIATAKSKNRPWDAILVVKWDRFARNTEDAAVYKSLLRNRCGVDIIAVQQPSEDTAVGRMVEGIMDVMAEFFSANLAEDTHRGMREKAKTGTGALGKPPFGFRIGDGDVWVIDEEEAAIVRWIYSCYLSGVGTSSLALFLRGPSGQAHFGEAATRRRWGPNTIRVILSNPAYIGTRVWGRSKTLRIDGTLRHRPCPESAHIVVDNAHPAIIDMDAWQAAQNLIRTRAGGERRAADDYLLRGLLRCGDCGGTLCAAWSRFRRKSGHKYERRSLVCNRYQHTGECSRQGIEYYRFEALVLEEVQAAAADPRQLVFAPPETPRHPTTAKLEARLHEIPMRIDRQLQAFEVGAITLEQLKMATERLRAEEQAIREQLAGESTKPDLKVFRARVSEALGLIESDEVALHVKRQALVQLIDHISWSKTKNQIEIVWRHP